MPRSRPIEQHVDGKLGEHGRDELPSPTPLAHQAWVIVVMDAGKERASHKPLVMSQASNQVAIIPSAGIYGD
jgi:hypothetical protein